MSVNFTLLNQQNVAVLNTTAKDIVVNEVFAGSTDGALKQFVKLTNGGSPVAVNSVFSKFNVSVSSSAVDDGDVTAVTDLVSASTEVQVGRLAGFAHADGTTNTLTISPTVAQSATAGDYVLTVELRDASTNAVVASQEVTFDVVSYETALTRYETIVANISTEDLATIDANKLAVVNAQQVALTAVNALDAGDDKTALQTRYKAAVANQNEAYKLLYLYLAKNNTLTLFKVKNVGGNVPYSVILKDDVLVGSASEAFMYFPAGYSAVSGSPITDDNEALTLTITDPKQTSLNLGNYLAGGDFYVILKVGDVYHKVYFTVDATGKVLQSVNGVTLTGLESAGTSFTPDGQAVSKVDLTAAIAKANGYLADHAAGTAPGNVPDAQRTVLSTAIAAAQLVADNVDAQADEVVAATTTLNAASTEFLTFVVKYTIDETGLQKAVDDANKLVNAAVVGVNVGQTTQEAIDAYKAAIAVAQKALTDIPGTVSYDDPAAFAKYEQDVTDAINALSAATTAYTSSIMTNVKFATKRIEEYEAAASTFLDSIRKKIRI